MLLCNTSTVEYCEYYLNLLESLESLLDSVKKRIIKGVWLEIFYFRFFSWISFHQATEYLIGAISIFYDGFEETGKPRLFPGQIMSGIDSIEPCVHCPPSGRHWYEQGMNRTILRLLTVLLTMPTITFNKTKRNSKYSKVRKVRIKCKGKNF